MQMRLLKNSTSRRKPTRRRSNSSVRRCKRRRGSRMRGKKLNSNCRRDYLLSPLTLKRELPSLKTLTSASLAKALLPSLEASPSKSSLSQWPKTKT